MISRELLKIHANRLAQANKQYYDANGDLYLGTSDSRLILFKKAHAGGNVVQPTQHINVDTTNDALTDEELRASPVDVNIVGDSTTTNTEILETLNETSEVIENISETVDFIAGAMDKENMTPVYVEDINGPLKRDASKALILSDSYGPFLARATQTGAVAIQIETTGYKSVVIQSTLSTTTSITGAVSNDGINWVGIIGYNTSSVAPTNGSITVTNAILAAFPCPAKYFRLIHGSASACAYNLYLKNVDVPSYFGNVGASLTNTGYISGTTVVTAGVLGLQAVGGNIAPGAARTSNPIPIAGTDSGNLTRVLRTNTNGELLLGGSLNALNYRNTNSLHIEDLTQAEGKNSVQLLSEVLEELKTLNLYIHELPMLLNRGLEFNDYK